jgi:phage-related protein
MVYTATGAAREKPLHWVGSAKKDYQAFPGEVQDDMGYALGVAQLGGKHPHAKPWKGEGPGVFEIVEDPSRRYVPRGLYGAFRGCRVCPACVPEEVEDRHQDAAG